MVTVPKDKLLTTNFIQYCSLKPKHFTYSVLPAKHSVALQAFDSTGIFLETMKECLGRVDLLAVFKDSNYFFDSVVSPNSTTEKHFLVDLIILWQTYEHFQFFAIVREHSSQIPTSAMTERTGRNVLSVPVKANKLACLAKMCTERP